MWRAAHWRCPRALLGQVLSGGYALYIVRRGSRFPVPVGGDSASRTEDVRVLGDDGLHRDRPGRPLLCMEKGRTRLGPGRHSKGRLLMALTPPITDIEQLKSHPALGRLTSWNAAVVQAVKFDRDELTIWIAKESIREVCAILRDFPDCPFNYLADLTCVDWYPSEPRFEVVYHLLSISTKERVRLKARLDGSSAAIESVTSVWPAANFYEREVFDLFGVRFSGHPNLERILMPDDWEGHPLRKDYPVEGYDRP